MSKSGNFLAGLLSGALVGSVLGLLFAPDSGKNTRGRLSYNLSTYKDDLTDLLAQLYKEKEQLMSEAKEKGEGVVKDAKAKADKLIEEAESILESIKKAE